MDIEELKSKAKEVLSDYTGRNTDIINDDTIIANEFDLDSLDSLELLIRLEDKIEMSIDEDMLSIDFEEETFGKLMSDIYKEL